MGSVFQLCGGRDGLLRDGAGRGSQEIPEPHPGAGGSPEGRADDRSFQGGGGGCGGERWGGVCVCVCVCVCVGVYKGGKRIKLSINDSSVIAVIYFFCFSLSHFR